MSEPICLTEDEVLALRQVLSMLAVIGERGFDDPDQMCRISYQMWKHEVLKPAQVLLRIPHRSRLT
jgi:hypothetical protein